MASSQKNLSDYSSANLTDVSKKRFAIVVSEWNEEVTESLYSGAYETLLQHGVNPKNIVRKQVPGSFGGALYRGKKRKGGGEECLFAEGIMPSGHGHRHRATRPGRSV